MGGGDRLLPGGSVTYAAGTWSRLGGTARVVTALGRDFPSGQLSPGVAVEAHCGPATTIFENRYRPDGGRSQFLESLAAPVGTDLLPLAWHRPRVLFIAPVIGELDPAEWLAVARPEIAALGVQGLVRQAKSGGRGTVSGRQLDCRADWLDAVDVAFLSEDDCLAQPDLPERLRERIALVVLTRAGRGCSVYRRGESFRVGSHPACERDPTGAGDTFAAGFLYVLATGGDCRRAACLGAACASIVIEGRATEALARLGGEARQRAGRISAQAQAD